MARLLHDRLRVLAIGIRPSVAAACGVESHGTVDMLDAQGIRGWQIGVRLLLHEAVKNGPAASALARWARAEIRCDVERWRHLASFVDTLERAMADHAADLAADGPDIERFWDVWQRNIAHAHGLLTSTGLAVCPAALATLEQLSHALPSDDVAGTAPKHVAELLETASALVDSDAAMPPPLVLPEHRDALVAHLTPVVAL